MGRRVHEPLVTPFCLSVCVGVVVAHQVGRHGYLKGPSHSQVFIEPGLTLVGPNRWVGRSHAAR